MMDAGIVEMEQWSDHRRVDRHGWNPASAADCYLARIQKSAPIDCHVPINRLPALAQSEERFEQDVSAFWVQRILRPHHAMAKAESSLRELDWNGEPLLCQSILGRDLVITSS